MPEVNPNPKKVLPKLTPPAAGRENKHANAPIRKYSACEPKRNPTVKSRGARSY